MAPLAPSALAIEDFVFSPPPVRSFTTLSDTFPVGRERFLAAAERAAATLHDPATGGWWAVDGCTSDTLVLRLPLPNWVWMPHLEIRLDVVFAVEDTTLKILSGSPAVLGLVLRFIAAVKADLLQGGQP